jgi:hypothetical protein
LQISLCCLRVIVIQAVLQLVMDPVNIILLVVLFESLI